MHLVQRVLLHSSWWAWMDLNHRRVGLQPTASTNWATDPYTRRHTLQIIGLEPMTHCLSDNCSTSWAKLATSRSVCWIRLYGCSRRIRTSYLGYEPSVLPLDDHCNILKWAVIKSYPGLYERKWKIGLKPISGANGWNRTTDHRDMNPGL